jgi:four helix bundle protein
MNILEGQRRAGRDRLHCYRIAAGSAAEVRGALTVATAWGYLTDEALAETRTLIDRELALLWRLTHARR